MTGALLLLAVSILPTNALAQGPQVREGFWAQVGLGAGFNRADCTNCSQEHWAEGGVLYVRAGGTVSRHVLLGLEAYGFRKAGGEEAESAVEGVVVMAQWYPWHHLGGYLKIGWGLSHGEAQFTRDGITSQGSRTGIATTIGLGWDIRVARNLSITPVVNTFVNGLGDVEFPGAGDLDDALTTLLMVGVGVTSH